MTDLTTAAIGFAKRGYAVFPLMPRSKAPATRHGFRDASADAGIVSGWWRSTADFNIGLPTGPRNGFWILDIDGDNGEASLRRLEFEHGQLPATFETLTGGGGRHVWFRWPRIADGPRNSASADCLGDGLDVRGDGGYIAAPPSIHKNGRPYEWSVDSADQIAPAPSWLLTLACEATKKRANGRWQAASQAPITEGKRNDALASVTGMLLHKGIDPGTTLSLIQAFNAYQCSPPIDAAEVDKIVNSIAGIDEHRRKGTRHGR